MPATATVTVESHVDAILARTDALLKGALKASAEELATQASANAARDTGSMAAGVYAVGPGVDTYAEAAAAAGALNQGAVILPREEPEGALSAVVADAAGHAEYVELGTTRAGAQPFMGPAAEWEQPRFEQRVADAVSAGVNG